jgi:hypothetical protein
LCKTSACCASLFEADTFGIPDGTKVLVSRTTYQAQRRSIEHCRDAWPSDAVRTAELLRLGIEGL